VPAFSNIISLDLYVPVAITVWSDSEYPVDGAEVNLSKLSGIHTYEGIVASGVVYCPNL